MNRRLDPVFSRIVVGVDGSSAAEEAVRQAAALAGATGAALDLVHVVDTTLASPSPWATGATAVREALEEAVRIASKEGIEPEARELFGGAASTLVSHAADRRADLIAVGPDAGFIERPRLMGGVAVHVLRDARCSVLVARPRGDDARPFRSNVLCAVDSGPPSMEAARVAALVARLTGARLQLVHAVPIRGSGGSIGWAVEEGTDGPDPLDRATGLARSEGVASSRELALGRPGPAIAEAAASSNTDLIVTGSRELQGVSRIFADSVSEWLVRHATCSVLVVRPRDR
jgi:nucleotide-binding universal stress UspA family protein